MENSFSAVVGELWNLHVNWDAWSAIGTILAAAVALFLPQRVAKREWARQDGIRVSDLERVEKAKQNVIHEVCSTVDRIVAYEKSALALFATDNVYQVGFEAIARIHENTETLLEMLELLKVRPELTDGALYVAVSSERLAKAVIAQTVAQDATTGANWNARLDALNAFEPLSSMIKVRNLKVRKFANLQNASDGAALILTKYTQLAEAIKISRTADSGAPDIRVTDEYF